MHSLGAWVLPTLTSESFPNPLLSTNFNSAKTQSAYINSLWTGRQQLLSKVPIEPEFYFLNLKFSAGSNATSASPTAHSANPVLQSGRQLEVTSMHYAQLRVSVCSSNIHASMFRCEFSCESESSQPAFLLFSSMHRSPGFHWSLGCDFSAKTDTGLSSQPRIV